MTMRKVPIKVQTFKTGTDWDDPRTGREKAEAFKVQYLAGGYTVRTLERDEHEVTVEVY